MLQWVNLTSVRNGRACWLWVAGLFLVVPVPALGQGLVPDTTADDAFGQPTFAAIDPNQPYGAPTAANLALSNAADIAVGRDGRIWIADSDNHRVLSWPALRFMKMGTPADFVLGQPDFTSNAPNNGGITPRSFFLPQGLWVDGGGNVWVCDAFNCRVLRFNNPLRDVTPWDADLVIGQRDLYSGEMNLGYGEDAVFPDGLLFPGRVVVRGTSVWVADSGNSRVLHYTRPQSNKPEADRVFGQYGRFTTRGVNNQGDGLDGCCPNAENFYNPIGIAVDGGGRLYVADWFNHRVLRFDDPLRSDTVADAVLGQPDFNSNDPDNGGLSSGLQNPIDLAFDAGGTLYLADAGNNRVLAYTDPLHTPRPTFVFGQLDRLDTDEINHGLGPFEADADALFGPTGVAVDRCGNLLIADTINQRALRFDLNDCPPPPRFGLSIR